MQTTTNYSLKKPEESDYADVLSLNQNADTIDAELKKAQTHRESSTIHVTAAEKTAWNGKAPGSLSGTVSTHTENSSIHTTAAEKQKWNGYLTNHNLTHQKSSTVHALTGLNGASGLVSCLFTAAADYETNDTFTVDGTAYTIAMQDGSDASDGLFVSGAVVSCVLDTVGKTVNFKASGGSLKYATGSQTAERTTVTSNQDYLFFNVTGLSFLPSMLYIQANESYALIGIDPPDESADLLFVNRSAITQSNGWVVYKDGGFEVHFGRASTGNTYFTVGTAYTYYAIGL